MKKELWRLVTRSAGKNINPAYPVSSIYEVSNLGRIRNAKTGNIIRPGADKVVLKTIMWGGCRCTFHRANIVAAVWFGIPTYNLKVKRVNKSLGYNIENLYVSGVMHA